jgi:hypothetical protein
MAEAATKATRARHPAAAVRTAGAASAANGSGPCMSDPSIIEALAAEHIRELHVAASRRVLAAFARCCRQPSRVTARFMRARAALVATRPGHGYDTACCSG